MVIRINCVSRASADVRRYFFTHRVVKPWNSLPVSAVDFSSLNHFRGSLHRIDFSSFLVQWRNYGRQWRQSPPGAHGKGAPRADSNVFFILFNYKIFSRLVAANDTALNTLRPIRPCFTANNNQLGL